MTNKEAIHELKCYHREDGTVPEEITLAIKAIEFKDKAKIAYYNSDCYMDFINYFSVLLKEAENDRRTDFG